MISPMVERVHLARCSGGLRRAARARSDAGGAGRRAPTQGAGSTVFWCCARWRVTPSRMVTCSRMARKYMKSTQPDNGLRNVGWTTPAGGEKSQAGRGIRAGDRL